MFRVSPLDIGMNGEGVGPFHSFNSVQERRLAWLVTAGIGPTSRMGEE